ncbi:cupin-like domain-containing protein [Chamaesiphon polymorphus]|uniref:Transcription factor n=1 Tax=Chamaesiphon polymorphus CCALA 037 TaxID=2107692 RepID=A0A2T1GMT8_9CYAN|nr:cupin-like domain-containing protein [Chamaesiphon polymorphus]PSB59229.1 transcription factor [Chamaesiphon polymorphus CCALA 037]
MSYSSIDPNSKSTIPAPIIEPNDPNFQQKFNQESFQFTHQLAGHPLFEIPRLVELANLVVAKGGRQKVHSSDGNVLVHQKWSDMPFKERFEEALAQIDESGSLIVIKSIQLDPEYDALLDRIVSELTMLTGINLHQEITWLEGYIFVSSPQTITPYHLDHESNFLLQIQGEEDVNLFDQRDRSVLTEQEIEHYFVGDLQAATYRQENQNKASVYHLVPGLAVHHPARAPHWLKNGDRTSVALSINFCMRSYDLEARVYQVNHYLRKLGLNPTPPGKSPLQDSLKQAFLGIFSKHKPDNKTDVVFSGIDRLKAPLKNIKL